LALSLLTEKEGSGGASPLSGTFFGTVGPSLPAKIVDLRVGQGFVPVIG